LQDWGQQQSGTAAGGDARQAPRWDTDWRPTRRSKKRGSTSAPTLAQQLIEIPQ
jgi:hypothetical protein